jgi:delta8-fatty-acid desaturase
MKAYRIAQVELPWTNLTPPICGGIYRAYSDRVEDDTVISNADDEADWSDSTLATSTDLGAEFLATVHDKIIDDRKPIQVLSNVGNRRQLSSLEVPNTCSLRKRTSRVEYIAALEQKEIDSDILAYPSLDSQTQEAITKEYRALHERVNNEGFYVCRYSEYGKDSIRYVVLFAAFLLFLNAKWYLTSAIFLGMFWVCQTLRSLAQQSHHC